MWLVWWLWLYCVIWLCFVDVVDMVVVLALVDLACCWFGLFVFFVCVD